MNHSDFVSRLSPLIDDATNVAAEAYDFLVSIDAGIVVFLIVMLLVFTNNNVLSEAHVDVWAKLFGCIAALGFALYSCTHDPHESQLLVGVRAVFVGLLARVLLLIFVPVSCFLWNVLVRSPTAKTKRCLSWLWDGLAKSWDALRWWTRRQWYRFFGPKPKTRQQFLKEAVDAAKEDYRFRSALLDDADLTDIEKLIAGQTVRQSLLRRLYDLLQ